MSADLLSLRDLTVEYPAADGCWRAVLRSVCLNVRRGERVGLVGESGSGKSVAALATLGLVAPPGRTAGGRVEVAGVDPATAGPGELRRIRRGEIGLVFQEAGAAFNPVLSIGAQIAEAVRAHRAVSRQESRRAARELMRRTALDEDGELFRAYPHQLSGGQVQRAMIALALAGDPALLIADEPTSALDVRTQARILDLLEELTDEGRALLLISHDLAVVRGLVDRVVVLYAGEVVESAPTEALFVRPLHPYSQELLEATSAGTPDGRLHARNGRATNGSGCRYADRCPVVEASCRTAHPRLENITPDRSLRCPVSLRLQPLDGERGGG